MIDRASPKLRDIRREAERTDAALTKLGVTMDGVGSAKQTKNIDNQARSVRTLGRETEQANTRASRSFRNLDRDVKNHVSGLKRLQTGLKDVFGEMWRLARPAGMILGLGTALGVAGQAIGALSGGVAGLLPRLVDLGGAFAPAIAGMAGLGIAAVTTKLAFGGIGAAVSGTAGALNKLTPAAARLAIQLRNMRPLLREFRISAGGGRGGLLDSIGGALRRVGSPRVRGTINGILSSTSANLGGIVRQATSRETSPAALADFTNIAGQGNVVVRDLAGGLLNLGDALRHIAVAARPLTMWMSTTILGWTKHAALLAKNGRESGRLAAFFDRTRVSLTNMGHILRNVWVTLRNLGRDARPLGNELFQAAERTTAGWARMTSTLSSRTGLTAQFLKMGPPIRAIFNLVGKLGTAIFHLGSTGGLTQTVNGLSKLVPALERILSTLATKFGPILAQTLTSLGNLIASLTADTGPLTVLFTVLDKTFRLLNAIINISGPTKAIFTSLFSTVLITKFLSKLGLISIGWQRVAATATEAAVAQNAALGGGIGLGPVFGRFSRAGGASRAGALATDAGFAARTAALGSRAVGGASVLGGGAAAAGLLGRARLGLGVASRFALPLLAISSIFGGLTAGRSGSFGNQARQTIFGGANAASLGLLGRIPGLAGRFATPDQRAAGAAVGIQRNVTQAMAADAAQYKGTERLTHQIQDLQRIAGTINDRQTQASQDLIKSIQDEIAARRSLRDQLNLEKMQAGASRGAKIVMGANAVARTQGTAAGVAYLHQQIARYPGGGAQNTAVRRQIEGGLLAQNPAAAAPYVTAVEAAAGHRVSVAARPPSSVGFADTSGQAAGIFSGGQAERTALKAQLSLGKGAGSKGQINAMIGDMVASLIAFGFTRALAFKRVNDWVRRGFRGRVITLADEIRIKGGNPLGIQVAPPPKPAAHQGGFFHSWLGGPILRARGGRVPGVGLQDTVPLGGGGMAAPGELVVNRHTERRVNGMLAGSGHSLGGLVDSESRRHSDTFATGGRVNWSGHPPINGAIADITRNVEGAFPSLQVTATTNGRHSNGSYHYLGEAVDLAGSPAAMLSAAAWINAKYGRSLLEGIHNPNLSIKNGRGVDPNFWGATTWANHANHIHIAAASLSAPGGASAGDRALTSATPRRPGRNIRSLSSLTRTNAATAALMGIDTGPLAGVAGTPFATATGATPSGAGTGGGGGSGTLLGLLQTAGFGGDALRTAWAVAMRESGGSASAFNGNAATGDQSYGLFQINMLGSLGPARRQQYGLSSNKQLLNPSVNARVTYQMSHSGTDWGAWGIGPNAYSGAPAAAHDRFEQLYKQFPGGSDAPLKLSTGGRAPRWGGWKAAGVNGVYSTPTVIGVGEKGAERVRVTPAGGHDGAQINATFHIYGGEQGQVQREVEAALKTFARHLAHHPIDGQDI